MAKYGTLNYGTISDIFVSSKWIVCNISTPVGNQFPVHLPSSAEVLRRLAVDLIFFRML